MSPQPAPQTAAAAAPRTRGARLAGPLAAAAAGLVGAGLILMSRPGDAGPVVCPFKALTGLDCPFCGATRATAALLHGDLLGAADQNAFYSLLVVPLGLVAWALWLATAWSGRPFPAISNRWVQLGLALVAAWWGLRLAVPWLGSGSS